jgi:hypothetical protein
MFEDKKFLLKVLVIQETTFPLYEEIEGIISVFPTLLFR